MFHFLAIYFYVTISHPLRLLLYDKDYNHGLQTLVQTQVITGFTKQLSIHVHKFPRIEVLR